MTDAELDELDKKMDDKKDEMRESYDKFWGEFGKSIKAGIVEDVPNRKKLAEVTRFYSSFNETKTLTNFKDYMERQEDNEKNGTDIFYIGGSQKEKMMKIPVVKGLVERGYEIIMCEEAIDEYTFQTLDKYHDTKLTNVGKAGFKIPQDEDFEKKLKKLDRYYQPLISYMKKTLGASVEKVSVGINSKEDPLIV